jgi:hypothetical protein
MTSWVPTLPEPPDYARQVVEAIARNDPNLPSRTSAVLKEIEDAATALTTATSAIVQRLEQDRQLILRLAQRFDIPPAKPTTEPEEANGSGPLVLTADDVRLTGLSQQQKIDINTRITNMLRADPQIESDELVDVIMAEYGPSYVWPVAQPRPTLGSMVYRVKRRMGLLPQESRA